MTTVLVGSERSCARQRIDIVKSYDVSRSILVSIHLQTEQMKYLHIQVQFNYLFPEALSAYEHLDRDEYISVITVYYMSYYQCLSIQS